jgi:galactokinase
MAAPHSTELASPLLHELLRLPDIAGDVYGSKGVGSQGDGTAQFVAKGAESRTAAMSKVSRAFPQMRCFPLTVTPQGGNR